MTTQEMIVELQQYPPDTKVYMEVDDDGCLRIARDVVIELRETRYNGQEPAGVYLRDK